MRSRLTAGMRAVRRLAARAARRLPPRRRFQAYGLGVSKSGTTSLARVCLPRYRSAHEPEWREVMRFILEVADGRRSEEELRRWVVERDARLRLEMDSSHLNSWLVEHLAEVPLHVIPCYEPYLPDRGGSSFWIATLYGSIFPAVWNFQLALHTRGYGTCITTLHLGHEQEISALLGVPESYVQSCLLPVGRLRSGQRFRPAPRRPVGEVVSVDRFDGPPL